MCEYVLCDTEMKKGEKYVLDPEGKIWHLSCHNLMLYRDLGSYHGYEIDRRIKELRENRIIKIKQ